MNSFDCSAAAAGLAAGTCPAQPIILMITIYFTEFQKDIKIMYFFLSKFCKQVTQLQINFIIFTFFTYQYSYFHHLLELQQQQNSSRPAGQVRPCHLVNYVFCSYCGIVFLLDNQMTKKSSNHSSYSGDITRRNKQVLDLIAYRS